MIDVKRTRYRSNVKGVGTELNKKLERIVARSARDAASHVRAISKVDAHALSAETVAGVVSARVIVPKSQYWATMLDKGTLGKRKLPLKQPGRRRDSWTVRRRAINPGTGAARSGATVVTQYTAHRSARALKSGGIKPQYFLVKGKRHGQKQLGRYLKRGL